MPFNEETIKQNRQIIGDFFAERRREMGHSLEKAAEHIGITANTLSRIEAGRFAFDIDLLMKMCESYEIKPFFVALEELKPSASLLPDFLLCPVEATSEVYILHRNFPECLIQVVQTIPLSFILKETYGFASEHDVLSHDIVNKAKTFFHDCIRKQDQN